MYEILLNDYGPMLEFAMVIYFTICFAQYCCSLTKLSHYMHIFYINMTKLLSVGS